MRKIIILLLLLCMHFSARGQTQYEYRYWFDGDITTAEKGSTTSDAWRMEVDLSRLTESFHSIHLQVTDEKGVSSSPVTRCFFLSREGGTLTNGYYWFDNEAQVREVESNIQGTLTFDVTELPQGFHSLHYQVLRADGLYSQIETRSFYKLQSDQAVGQLTFMCYVDGSTFKQERVSAENGVATWVLDVSDLPIGFHKLQVRAIMENGASTSIREAFFLRAATEAEQGSLTCICSIDGKVFKQETLQATNGGALWQLDVSELPIGFHKLQLRAMMGKGGSTSIREAFFLRNAMDSEMEALSCVFSIDGQPYKIVEGGVREGVFHCDLDVAALSDGLHKIAYILTNGKGDQTTVKSQYFVKQPVGGNSIKMYQYWLNDKDDMAHTVKQEKVTDPLQLISLLPVESQPLRSSLFHFEAKDGKPMIYAKNDIHFRFYDNSGRWVDADDQYIDYAFSRNVEPVGELQPKQTFNKVGDNAIRWYTMQAAPGDTAAFKLSQAATIQVFAPSGKEVFKTSESESVKWAGIHTWEDGTYYVAVHDVTGSQSTMTLDYMHMDKYDVVDWDVHTVGNGGCSTITFKGNGFRDLYAVDLVVAPGDTIHSLDISHDSDAETAVTFDFTDVTLGEYNAVFHFTEDDKRVSKVVTAEEPVDIELATNVSFPSYFLRGTSTTYTIKITNKGNMTAYAVPIYAYIRGTSENSIDNVVINGINKVGLFDFVDVDSLSNQDKEELRQIKKSIGDKLDFIATLVDGQRYGISDSILVLSNYFFVNLLPNSTKTISFTISTNDRIDAWFTVPDEWFSLNTDKKTFQIARKRLSPSNAEAICCYREKFECFFKASASFFGILNFITDLAPADKRVKIAMNVFDCASNIINDAQSYMWTVSCGEKEPLGGEDMFTDMMAKIFNLHNNSHIGTICACIQAVFPSLKMINIISKIGKASSTLDLLGLAEVTSECQEAFTEWKPGCPPDPPGGGTSTPQPPSDPNDIFGYLSDAGSRFIADSVARVNYTIEFENDTTFATASAHTIVIRDTLDSRYFDRSVFAPTGVRIGEHEVFLEEKDVSTKNGRTTFVKTIDMRPEINAIAQVEGEYSQQTGIATWTFTSLDPMTMEPTDDLMQGILPVNHDGTSGIGEVMFEVGVKPNKGDGTEVKNRAGIVFDYEKPIMTPAWVNTVDAVAPTSVITDVTMENDTIARLHVTVEDNLSGIWYYDVYAQYGKDAMWVKVGERVTEPHFDFRVYEDIDYGYCVLAVDSAGNAEKKEISREWPKPVGIQDANQSPTLDNEPTYDLQGRPAQPIQKGVYVQRGKKRLIKRK